MMQTVNATAAIRSAIPVLVLTLLVAGGAGAEPAAAGLAEPTRSAGLSFLIERDLGVSALDGALLSYRTRGASGHGWRYGISLSGTLGQDELQMVRADTSSGLLANAQRSASVGLTVLRVREHCRDRPFGYYWAVGPTAGYGFDRRAYDNDVNERVIRNNSWRAGLVGVMGVEWRASEDLSLLAEYGGALTYSWSQRREWVGENELILSTRSASLGARNASLGLTAWF